MINPKAKTFINHIKTYILRGVITSIPLVLSVIVIGFIYVFIDKRVTNLIYKFLGFSIPGLGLILALVFFYIVGVMASNVIGKRFLKLIDNVLSRIPVIKAIHQLGSQISSTLSTPAKQIFKRVVLVDCFNSGVLTIGFVTGEVVRQEGILLKVFLPTVPNPTTGFIVFVESNKAIDPNWTVEEGLKMVISGGIIGPTDIKK